MASLRTESYADSNGAPSKRVVVEADGREISIALGAPEAAALSAALKPNGRDITLSGREVKR